MNLLYLIRIKQVSFSMFILLINIILTTNVNAVPNDIGPERFIVQAENGNFSIPYFGTAEITTEDNTITRAIIYIHGGGRASSQAFQQIMSSAENLGMSSNTIIIAPQFLENQDIISHNLGNDILQWDDWGRGDLSLNGSSPISSYSVLDSIILALLSNKNNLATIIVAGHSEGGQFTLFYGGGNQIDNPQVNIHFTYIPSNPGAYLYLDEKRPVFSDRIDSFLTPTNCIGYNDYRRGLDNLNSYMLNTGAQSILNNYREREFIYLLGANDTEILSSSCESSLQGRYRLERGKLYYHHIVNALGLTIQNNHQQAIIPNFNHTNMIFSSACAEHYMFGIGECIYTTPTHLQASIRGSQIDLTWQDRSGNEGGYIIERSDNNTVDFTQIGSVGVEINEFSDLSISDFNAQYDYRVKGVVSSIGNGYSNLFTINKSINIPTENNQDNIPLPPTNNTPSSGGTISSLLLYIFLYFTLKRSRQ